MTPDFCDVAAARFSAAPERARRPPSDALKEGLDFLLATALLAPAAVLCGIAAVAIRLTSPGPILYRQRRVGRGGREFMMYKLRTMRDGAEDESGPVLARRADERVTPVGRVLRACRLDELPQLLNVLGGTMSLIGPRPERPEFVAEFAHRIPNYARRLAVKPGLSGLAQVRAGYHAAPAEKLGYDLEYIERRSLGLDLRILAATLGAVLAGRGV
jgi:lipopolysaccharide/colanic/teichoic acid biosynthesis glycosyltransferase